MISEHQLLWHDLSCGAYGTQSSGALLHSSSILTISLFSSLHQLLCIKFS